MTRKEILEIANKYALNNLVIGYPDFEDILFKFAEEIFENGVNCGILTERSFMEILLCCESKNC